MTPEMAFECLLISHDPAVYCTINKVLRNFSITVDHSLSSSKACEVIGKRTHDLVVIDWEGEPSTELLHTIWSLHNKRKPTLVAIADENSSVPGVHLTLRKPVTLESGTASLKNAYSRMLLDHRLHARYAIMTSVIATDGSEREFPVKVTDIGDRGVGLNSRLELAIGDTLFFALKLPGTTKPINIQARVV